MRNGSRGNRAPEPVALLASRSATGAPRGGAVARGGLALLLPPGGLRAVARAVALAAEARAADPHGLRAGSAEEESVDVHRQVPEGTGLGCRRSADILGLRSRAGPRRSRLAPTPKLGSPRFAFARVPHLYAPAAARTRPPPRGLRRRRRKRRRSTVKSTVRGKNEEPSTCGGHPRKPPDFRGS